MWCTSAWSLSFSCLSSCCSCSFSWDTSSLSSLLVWVWRPLECRAISKTSFCDEQKTRFLILSFLDWTFGPRLTDFMSPRSHRDKEDSYFTVGVLQLFLQNCNIMFERIPFLLWNTEIRLKTRTLIVHSLKSFIYCLHLERGEKKVKFSFNIKITLMRALVLKHALIK